MSGSESVWDSEVRGILKCYGLLDFDARPLRLSDACFLLSVLGAVGFHISNPVRHEWIARRMPYWTENYFGRFLAGESPLAADGEGGTAA